MGNQVTPFARQQVIGYDARVAGQSVADFCRRLGISTSSFYRIRARARAEGTAAALTARSRAPRSPARRWGTDTDAEIARVRAELIVQGREAGPWSVRWVMSAGGTLPAPSRATIARRLRAMGLVTPAPRKRPRVSYKRFTRTAANELWQIDGIQWVLHGRLVTIYQVIDDCSRLLVGLRACAGGERARDAQAVLADAFEAWGAPAAVLSDNGRAFNTHRSTGVGPTEKWLAARGVRPISGRVGHPQTQGKVERSHQPVQDWLAAHPASSLRALNAELDRFTAYYNTERQHQGVGIALTPLAVWSSVPRALAAPSPINPDTLPGAGPRTTPPLPGTHAGTETTKGVGGNGTLRYKARLINVGRRLAGARVLIVEHPHRLDLFDPDGEHFASIPWPKPTQAQLGSYRAIDAVHPPYRITPAPASPKP